MTLMAGTRSVAETTEAAVEVTREWTNLAELAVALRDTSTTPGVRAGLADGYLVCDRALILFLCGGQDGKHDRRDITPKDFLGEDWWPDDEEMDQRLRGRLAVMARQKAHLSWGRVLNKNGVLWPYSLLAWETSWSMARFVRQLERASAIAAPVFQEAEQQARRVLGPEEHWRAFTSEYGVPRPGQTDRRLRNSGGR